MKIGAMELVVIFIVALLVIGPDKLPSYAKKLGGALKEFRKASESISKELREDVIEPLEDATEPIREAVEPLTDLSNQVQNDLKGVTKSINDIGKPKKAAKKEEKPAEEKTAESAPASTEEAKPASVKAEEPQAEAAPEVQSEAVPAPAETQDKAAETV